MRATEFTSSWLTYEISVDCTYCINPAPATLSVDLISVNTRGKKRKATSPSTILSPKKSRQAFSAPVSPAAAPSSPTSPRRSERIRVAATPIDIEPLSIIIPEISEPQTAPLQSCVFLHQIRGARYKDDVIPFDFGSISLPFAIQSPRLIPERETNESEELHADEVKAHDELNEIVTASLSILNDWILAGDMQASIEKSPHSRSFYFYEYDQAKQLFSSDIRQTRVTIHIIERENKKSALINLKLNIPKKIEKYLKIEMLDFFICSTGELVKPICHFNGIDLLDNEDSDISENTDESTGSSTEGDDSDSN